MGFAFFHVQKGHNSSATSLGYHIDREKGKENCYKHANPAKKDLNVEYMHEFKGVTLQESVNKVIAREYKGKTIRQDAVKYLTHILTGSHTDMVNIFADPTKKENWIKANRKYIEDNFGKNNICRFTLHLDEKTPHIHCVTVPVTKDGRLSAKEIVGNNKNLKLLQDKYAIAMQEFGLIRGISSDKERIPTKEFYKAVSNAIPDEALKEKANKFIKDDVSKNIIEFINKSNKRIDTEIGRLIDNAQISILTLQKDKNALKSEITAKKIEILRDEYSKFSKSLPSFDKIVDFLGNKTALNIGTAYVEKEKQLFVSKANERLQKDNSTKNIKSILSDLDDEALDKLSEKRNKTALTSLISRVKEDRVLKNHKDNSRDL